MPNFIKRKRPRKEEKQKQGTMTKVQARKQPKGDRSQGGKGTIKNQTLHQLHEAYQLKRGGGKLDKSTTICYLCNYFTPFFTHQHGYKNVNLHVPFHVHHIYILIEIKFKIDIDNDKLLIKRTGRKIVTDSRGSA